MIIGISGWKRHGKDTVAAMLVEQGFERVAFADRMRAALLALNPQVFDDELEAPWRLADLVARYGWDDAKEKFPEVREIMQRFGTECGRNHLGEDVWVNATMLDIEPFPAKHFVISDVRFPNEARAIKVRGGFVWRVTRPGVPTDSHVSEHALDDWDFDRYILNAGSLEDLREEVGDTLWREALVSSLNDLT